VQSDPGATEAAVASAVAQDTLDALAPTEEVAARDAIADGAPDGLPIVEGAIAAEQVRGETKTVKLRKTAALADDPHEIRRKLSEPRQKGGARSRTASASGASSGRVSASTGSAVDYAARVRARVAGHKPAGAGRSGTVIISFAISRSGGVSYASVARSSGDPTLDRSVLSAVRGAGPFPVPPPGADPRFSMPFYFR
jgi:protein TonB